MKLVCDFAEWLVEFAETSFSEFLPLALLITNGTEFHMYLEYIFDISRLRCTPGRVEVSNQGVPVAVDHAYGVEKCPRRTCSLHYPELWCHLREYPDSSGCNEFEQSEFDFELAYYE